MIEDAMRLFIKTFIVLIPTEYSSLFLRMITKTKKFNQDDIDVAIIDSKGPIGVANNIWKAASYCRKAQNGKVFSYAIVMFIGIVIFVSLLFF